MDQKHKDSMVGKLASCSVSAVPGKPLISIEVVYRNGVRSDLFLDVTAARGLATNILLTLDNQQALAEN